MAFQGATEATRFKLIAPETLQVLQQHRREQGIAALDLARDGNEIPVQKTAKNKRIVAAIKETSDVLGNTPAVCRGSYVCPEIISAFEKGQVIDNYASSLDNLIAYRGSGLHKAEQALLKFLKRGVR